VKYIDNFLNNITMYRLVAYGLGIIELVAVFFASFGLLHFDPLWVLASFVVLAGSVFVSEWLFAILWSRTMNYESWFITASILFFIISPARDGGSLLFLALASVVASGSKFVLAWRGKHIFNPAALAAAVLSLGGLWPVSWWIGSNSLWWIALVFGFLVIRKIRRAGMALWFAVLAVVIQVVHLMLESQLTMGNMQHALIASPLIFLGSLMLTEPATMPARRSQQYLFATVVAVLYALSPNIGPLYFYPEVALLLGNVYAFAVSPKFFMRLRLKAIDEIAPNILNFRFQPTRPFTFLPGQYMEWTLPGVPLDGRSNRRMFTIASSPDEKEVMLGVKFYKPSSNYKQTLRQLKPGASIYASQLAGSFTMPRDQKQKLLFIAGGVGITPFRSMMKTMIDDDAMRDVVLLYAVATEQEIAYGEVFDEARQRGAKVHYIIANRPSNEPSEYAISGTLTSEVLKELVPDLQERTAFISGPSGMVDGVKHTLRSLGVHRRDIKTDHFSGY